MFDLKAPIHDPKTVFFWGGGISPLKRGAISMKHPKSTALYECSSFEPSSVKIRWRVWPLSEFQKKCINQYTNKNNRYIAPICREATRWRICTKFGTAVGIPDVIICCNSFGDRSTGVDCVCGWGGSKIALSHWQSQSSLTQGWRCHAARDQSTRQCLNVAAAGWTSAYQLCLK